MTKKNELNIEEIKKLIPHRYPFLLIDKLIDIIPKESAVGVKNVTFNENFFQGHFESMSVMPGALIIESMAQSAGTLVMYSLKKIKKIFQYTYLLLIKLNLESLYVQEILYFTEWKKNKMSKISGNLNVLLLLMKN